MALAGTLAALAGCDRLPEAVIFPEFEFSFSFENGLEGWTPYSADVGSGSASVTGTRDRASAGSGSLLLTTSNPGGTAKVWVVRELEVTPEQRYTIEVSFDLSTADHATVDPWVLFVGAGDTEPTNAAELTVQGDTSSGLDSGSGPVWAPRSFTLTATADEDGFLYVTLGVWGTSPGDRVHALDDVRLVLTRD